MIISIISNLRTETKEIEAILSKYTDNKFEFISPYLTKRLEAKNIKSICALKPFSRSENFSDYSVANGDYVIVLRENFKPKDLAHILTLIGRYDVFEAGKTTFISRLVLRNNFNKSVIPLRTSIAMYSRRALSVADKGGSMRHSLLAQLHGSSYLIGYKTEFDRKIFSKVELSNLFTLLLFHTNFFPKIVKKFAVISFIFVLFFGIHVIYKYISGYTVEGWPSIILTLLIIQSSMSLYILVLFKYIKHIFTDSNRVKSVNEYTIL